MEKVYEVVFDKDHFESLLDQFKNNVLENFKSQKLTPGEADMYLNEYIANIRADMRKEEEKANKYDAITKGTKRFSLMPTMKALKKYGEAIENIEKMKMEISMYMELKAKVNKVLKNNK